MDQAQVYIVDIDGTIADMSHRLPFINGEAKNWDAFFDACVEDKPIEDVIRVVRALAFYQFHADGKTEIIYLTGRPERVRDKTSAWLLANGLPNGQLLMRRDGDHRPDTKAKLELMLDIVVASKRIAGVFEDRPAVIRVWREMGLTVFQMNDKEF